MEKILNVPYFSQRDNSYNPSGSCNVTSIAMALYYWGIRGDGSQSQLEDQLYRRCQDRGLSRHSPWDLKTLVESYPGCKDDFTDNGTIALIRKALDEGKVCVVHGYTTGYGHIFVIKGYKEKLFLCNDPWGEWKPWTYAQQHGGNIYYSEKMVAATCSAFSQGEAMELYETMNQQKIDAAKGIWLHRIWREK